MTVYGKASPQSVNNTTTFADVTWDTALPTLSANTKYRFEAFLIVTSGATPDIKLTVAKNAGLSDGEAEWSVADPGNFYPALPFASSQTFGQSGTNRLIGLTGFILVGTDPGSFKIQFAQATANVSDTTVICAVLEIFDTEAGELIGKAADQSRTSTAVVADDSALVSSTLDANSVYKMNARIPMTAGNTLPDIRYTFDSAGLSDADLYFRPAQGTGDVLSMGDENQVALTTASLMACPVGVLVTGTNTGALAFQWAQLFSDATSVTVRAGAVMRLVKAS